MNHEEQYSIWPAHRENPLGWNDVGKSGPKQECLDYIKEVWTDMRPLSLRKKMEEMEREQGSQASEAAADGPVGGSRRATLGRLPYLRRPPLALIVRSTIPRAVAGLPRAHPREMRMFCFPYAGGGASIYRGWGASLPADIEVCPVQLPGRESRLRDQPFDHIGPMVAAIADALRPT